ncbi:MAG: anti-sigma regulatory factor [Acidobacteria bacterium]|nr:MAG: anti-sigma regulatory factor [Acidobacteriota bacterium]PIE90933.1 MAG: anti-sigma regulatory factor [Acidobacteriota bacterium]
MNSYGSEGRPVFFSTEFLSSYQDMESVLSESFGFLKENDFPLPDFSLELILRESLVNAIKHGNKMDSSKSVFFKLEIVKKNNLKIVIEDEGDGFDWNGVLNREMPEVEQEHGRGLLLMKEYDYNPVWNEKGNKLTLTRMIKDPCDQN